MTLSSESVHGTCVAIGSRGVLLVGPSGAGKSDLALRLIDRGARLVSDDYTLVTREAGVAVARAPASLAGKLEVRGIGIVAVEHQTACPLMLIVDLTRAGERLPEPDQRRTLAGVALPVVLLDAFAASAAIKVEWALRGAS